MQINEKIKQARLSRGWTQEEIAEKLEEKRSTYAEWERKTVPQADVLVKIAAVTGVPILDFIAAIDEKVAQGLPADEKSEKPDSSLIHNDQIVLVEAKSLGASYERIIEEKEARRRDAEAFAKKMEDHYNDAKQDKEKLFFTINEVLKPIKDKTEAIETNLTQTRELLKDQVYVVSRQLVDLQEAGKLKQREIPVQPRPPFVKKDKISPEKSNQGSKKGSSH